MSRGVLLTLILALVAGALGLWAGRAVTTREHSRTSTPAATTVGDAVPPITLPDLSGQARRLSEWQGRPLLINFWASWCAPCVEEMPLLDAYALQEPDIGVQVVGIALDEPDAVVRFLGRNPVTYPILLDRAGPNDSSVQLGNAIGALPYSVLVDASGRVLAQKLGPFRDDELKSWTAPAR